MNVVAPDGVVQEQLEDECSTQDGHQPWNAVVATECEEEERELGEGGSDQERSHQQHHTQRDQHGLSRQSRDRQRGKLRTTIQVLLERCPALKKVDSLDSEGDSDDDSEARLGRFINIR